MTPEQAARRWRQAQVAQSRRDVELETFPTTAGSASKVSHPMFGTGRPASPARARLPGLVTEPPAPAGLTAWGTWNPAAIEHVGGGYHLVAINLQSQDAGWWDGSDYLRWAIAIWLLRPDGTFSDAWVSDGNTVRPYTQGRPEPMPDASQAPPYGEPTDASTMKLTRWQEGALLCFQAFVDERQYVDDTAGFWPQYDTTDLDVPFSATVYYHVGHDGTDPIVGPALELYSGADDDFPTDGDWDTGGGATVFADSIIEGFEVIGPSADPNIAVFGLAYGPTRYRIWLLDKDDDQNITLTARTTWDPAVNLANPAGLTRIAADRWVAAASQQWASERGMTAILFNAKTGTIVDTVKWDVAGDRVGPYFIVGFYVYYAGNHLHWDGTRVHAAYVARLDNDDLQHRYLTLTVAGDTLTAGTVDGWATQEELANNRWLYSSRWVETCEGCLRLISSWDRRQQALFERGRFKDGPSPLPSTEDDLGTGVYFDQRVVPSSHPAGFMWAVNVGLATYTFPGLVLPKLIRYPA